MATKRQKATAQARRRGRRAEMRKRGVSREELTAAEVAEIDALVAAAQEPVLAPESPETAALELLDATLADPRELATVQPGDDLERVTATFRIVFPDDIVAEAGRLLADGALLVEDAPDDQHGFDYATLSSAIEGRFAERLARHATFTLADFEVEPPVVVEPAADAPAPRGPSQWTAIFVPEATLTDDGRAFAPEALTWRELPLTLMGLNETSGEGGHDGAVACGRIDRIWRDGLLIRAAGIFSEDETGTYYATNVGDGTIRGLSVDIAIQDWERGPKSDYFDADGNWSPVEAAAQGDGDEEPSIEALFDAVEDEIFVVWKAVIGMATVCPFPAFAGANISLVASGAIWRYAHQGAFVVVAGKPVEALVASAAEDAPAPQTPCAGCDHAYADHGEACEVDGCSCAGYESSDDEEMGLTASAAGLAPVKPPLEWFQDPELEELTPLTVTDEGQIFGHAWPWGACHTGLPGCTTAPRSMTNYAYFRTGEIECEDGSRVAVGRITFDTGHAGQRASKAAAIAHYDDTGKVGAYVVVGEDEFGGWIAGTLAASITAEEAQTMGGAVPSGDWRSVDGNLELIGLLAVNIPGFPVQRVRGYGVGLEPLALTAAGVGEMLRERTPEDDFREIEVLAAEARGDFAALAEQARG